MLPLEAPSRPRAFPLLSVAIAALLLGPGCSRSAAPPLNEAAAGKASPALISQPSIGAARMIDAPIRIPTGQSITPKLAFDGTNYLSVYSQSSSIGAARIAPDGTLLDPYGLTLFAGTWTVSSPAVAFDGTSYLVVWEDARNGNSNYDIYGVRVAKSGAVLDAAPIAICTNLAQQSSPAVAANPHGGFLVAWGDLRNASTYLDIYSARVSADGTVLEPGGTGLSISTYNQDGPKIAFDGTNYLVVFDDDRDAQNTSIYGARVSPATGASLDGTGFKIAQGGTHQWLAPSVAFNGTNYLVVFGGFYYGSGAYTDSIAAVRVTPAGAVLDAAPIAVSNNPGSYFPAVGSDGTSFLISWEQAAPSSGVRDIYETVISASGAVATVDGAPLPTGGVAGTTLQDGSTIAFDGTHYLVGWMSSPAAGRRYDTYGRRLSAAGVPVDAAPLLLSAQMDNTEAQATLAFDGALLLAAWDDNRSGGYDVYAARLGIDGALLDSAVTALSDAGTAYGPVAAGGAGRFLVVWNDSRNSSTTGTDLYAAMLSEDGGVLIPAWPVVNAVGAQGSPSVSFNGTQFVLAWSDSRASANSPSIYQAFVALDGGVSPPNGARLLADTSAQWSPLVSSNGGTTLTVWSTGDYRMIAARTAADGGLLDPAGISLPARGAYPYPSGLTTNGADWLVAWNDFDAGASHAYEVEATRVGLDGGILDATPISLLPSSSSYAAVADYDGVNYLLAWQSPDSSNVSSLGGGRISPNGVGLDPGGFPISQGTGFNGDNNVQIVSTGPGRSVLSYGAYSTTGGIQNSRVYLRSLVELPVGIACQTPGACASGYCVDGVCCADACAGQCASCNLPGSAGSCVAVTGAPQGGRAACAGAGGVCAGACDGLDTTACAYPGEATTCAPATCSSNTAHASSCDGQGTCLTRVLKLCAPYPCQGAACATACSTSLDCVAGDYCASGACLPSVAQGGACSGDAACATGHCADGVCCDRACDGQCEACGSAGVCAPVTGAPQGARAACGGSGACAGACDGTQADRCAFPGATQSCGAAACAAGVASGARSCDGAGVCGSAAQRNCAPYVCGAAVCKTSCASAGDCVSGLACNQGACVEPPDAGPASSGSGGCASAGAGLWSLLAAVLWFRGRGKPA